MKTYGGVDVEIRIFLTSPPVECKSVLHDPAALLPWKTDLVVHSIGG
jgi:hypothetical protein